MGRGVREQSYELERAVANTEMGIEIARHSGSGSAGKRGTWDPSLRTTPYASSQAYVIIRTQNSNKEQHRKAEKMRGNSVKRQVSIEEPNRSMYEVSVCLEE